MEGRALPALLAAALAAGAAGCCGLTRSAGMRGLDRDSPERAFEFVKAAFAEDSTRDQYLSLHPDFRDAQGLDETKYSLARSLSPGLFEKAAALLGGAVLDGPIRRGLAVETPRGPRAAARVALRTSGGAGVFVLVDEPRFVLVTTDGEAPGPVRSVADAVRLSGDRVRVGLDEPLFLPPPDGAEVLRVTIHHDWLLYGIERLEGFEEFLGEVRDTADRAGPTKEAPK
jgi:hypothetical protein